MARNRRPGHNLAESLFALFVTILLVLGGIAGGKYIIENELFGDGDSSIPPASSQPITSEEPGTSEEPVDDRLNLVKFNFETTIKGRELNNTSAVDYFNQSTSTPIISHIPTRGEIENSDATDEYIYKAFQDGFLKFGSASQLGKIAVKFLDDYKFNAFKIVASNYTSFNSVAGTYSSDQSYLTINGYSSDMLPTNFEDNTIPPQKETITYMFPKLQEHLRIDGAGKRVFIHEIELWTDESELKTLEYHFKLNQINDWEIGCDYWVLDNYMSFNNFTDMPSFISKESTSEYTLLKFNDLFLWEFNSVPGYVLIQEIYQESGSMVLAVYDFDMTLQFGLYDFTNAEIIQSGEDYVANPTFIAFD